MKTCFKVCGAQHMSHAVAVVWFDCLRVRTSGIDSSVLSGASVDGTSVGMPYVSITFWHVFGTFLGQPAEAAPNVEHSQHDRSESVTIVDGAIELYFFRLNRCVDFCDGLCSRGRREWLWV